MLPKNVADEFEQCIKCGLCQATCPVCKELLLEKYTPRGKIQLARFYQQGALTLSDHYRDIFSRCLLCGACGATCPSGVELTSVFLNMREEIARERGLPPIMEEVVASLLANHNISDEDNEDRGEWTESLKDLPEHGYQKEKAEVAYFVGCVASLFPMVQKIPRNLVRILDGAGVDFAILGGEEWCCGFPLIGAGVPDKAGEMMAHNLERVKALGAGKVVFSCPTCYRTWKEYYDTDLELLHDTEFIEKLVKNGSIRLGELNATVTYHDPCDLGRHCGVYDAPREILRAIPGLTLVELEGNRAKSVCCGGGGNVEMADADLSASVAQKKIEEIQRTGADMVVTSCQQCVRTITTRARRQKVDLTVCDITELVLESVSRA
jgi:heterodisulfide reductase subunit D